MLLPKVWIEWLLLGKKMVENRTKLSKKSEKGLLEKKKWLGIEQN